MTNAVDGSKFNGPVQSIAVQSDGKILVGGYFTNYAGTAGRDRLVKLNSDGTLLSLGSSAGILTQTQYNTPNTWQIIVGKAISSTEILINPDLASSAIFIEDNGSLVTINNNQTSPLGIAGLSFNSSVHRAFNVEYWVRRIQEIAPSTYVEWVESGELRGVYNKTNNTWYMNNYGIVGNAQISFTIDSSGLVRYTTTDLGTQTLGAMYYEFKTLLKV